ncbi:MAG: amidohydrolase [Candidatus Rifleibacteriota bacterium]
MQQNYFYNFDGRNLPDYSKKQFDSMLVLNGTILKTGFQLPFLTTSDIEAIDLKGAVVFSSFSDAHVHFSQTAMAKCGCDLSKARNLSEVYDLIKEASGKYPLVLAYNLQEQQLKEKRLPELKQLDKISNQKIIWVARKDLHSAVLNSVALKWASSLSSDLTHDNGFISGKCYNTSAGRLLDVIPEEMLKEGMEKSADECLENGVTFIHALEGSKNSDREPLLTNDFLNLHPLDGVIYHQSTNPALAKKNNWPGFGGCLLVDGSIGTRTAALNQPYHDKAETSGNLYLEADDLEALLKSGKDSNLQLALHAIGDRAIDKVASSYLWAKEKFPDSNIKNRIEHMVLPSTRAIRNIRQSNAMVCIQPLFDYYWGGKGRLYEQRLGYDRARDCNPFKTILDLGITVACGSDSPVTPIDPIKGIHALVNHSNPDEAIDLNSSLLLYISEPFKLIGKEKTRGQLKTGFKADFVCLSQDPFMVPPSRLQTIEVSKTFINGVEV